MARKASKNNYIDNERFYQAMVEHYEKVKVAKARGESPRVPVSNYIGKCIYDISVNFSLRDNFIGYSYRQEMVSDAIETCLWNAHHFNPEKSRNPFSYFTKVVYHAFIHRLQLEKREEYIKFKYTENQVLTGGIVTGGDDGGFDSGSTVDLNTEYYIKLAQQFEKPKKPKKEKTGVELFLEDDEEKPEFGIGHNGAPSRIEE